MYTSLCFTPRRYPLLHGPSALSLSIPFSVFLPSLYPSFSGPPSLIIFQLAVLICHINSFYTKACDIMFCAILYSSLCWTSTWFLPGSAKPTAGVLWGTHTTIQYAESAGNEQGKGGDLSQCASPRQGTKSWGGAIKLVPSDPSDFHSPYNYWDRRKSNSAIEDRQDWLSAHHQNSVKPLAWQPTDLRSPSIVCLIDYFPCNYSRVTLNISPLQDGGKWDFLFEGRHSYCHMCVSLMWLVRRHMFEIEVRNGPSVVDGVNWLCCNATVWLQAIVLVFMPAEQRSWTFCELVLLIGFTVFTV